MFLPDPDVRTLAKHGSHMFKVMVGLDPLGDFSYVGGLGYDVEPEEYNEAGRNHAPVRLPFQDGNPGKPGEITLRWGMIIRSKLFRWMDAVDAGGDFLKDIYIFQLSRKRLPLRVYTLVDAWPTSWTASELQTESQAELATEELKIVCDQIRMTNMSAAAVIGDLADMFGSEDTSERALFRWERLARAYTAEPPVERMALERSYDAKWVQPEFTPWQLEAPEPPQLEDGEKTRRFEFLRFAHDYVPKPATWGSEERVRKAYQALVAEWGVDVDRGGRRKYDALVSSWSEPEHLDRDYVAEAGQGFDDVAGAAEPGDGGEGAK